MRVALHVGQLHQPVPGGIGTYVRGLVRSLNGPGNRVGMDLVTFASGPPPEDIPPERYIRLTEPPGRIRYASWTILRRPRVSIRCDVLHAPSLAIPPTGSPLVVTVHDLAFLRQPQAFTTWGRWFHHRGLELARRVAALVVAPSNYVADDLDRLGFGGRVRVIPHGLDHPSDAGSRPDTLNRLGIRGPFILWVGTIEPRKGLETLIAGMERLRDPKVQLVVTGPKGWGGAVWDSVRQDDRGRLVLTGHVPFGVLDALYRQASVFAFPSTDEGFGFPPLEAMSRGCPVVAASAGALPEVLGDAAILVPPGDPETLASALGSVLEDAGVRRRLRAAGLERASRYTWDRSARAHVDLYREAMAS